MEVLPTGDDMFLLPRCVFDEIVEGSLPVLAGLFQVSSGIAMA